MKSTDFRNLTAQDISDILYVLIKEKSSIKVVEDGEKRYIIMPNVKQEKIELVKPYKSKHKVNLASGDWKYEDVSDLL